MNMKQATYCNDYVGTALVHEVEQWEGATLLGCRMTNGMATDTSDVTFFRPDGIKKVEHLEEVNNEILTVSGVHVNGKITRYTYGKEFVVILGSTDVDVRPRDIIIFHDTNYMAG